MSEMEELRQRLRARLDEADGLALRYRRALRRDLLAWIIIAATLGALVALYEHKVFCQGVFWGVNSFDQWGVELGKAQASSLTPRVEGAEGEAQDGSTEGLLSRYHALREEGA